LFDLVKYALLGLVFPQHAQVFMHQVRHVYPVRQALLRQRDRHLEHGQHRVVVRVALRHPRREAGGEVAPLQSTQQTTRPLVA
jgi:hypothetical protein